MFDEITKIEPKNSVVEKLIQQHEIILYNDNVNTFDHVIDSLVDYCDHTAIQAEQCAHLVHFTGKCAIKTGTFEELKPIHKALAEKSLSVELN